MSATGGKPLLTLRTAQSPSGRTSKRSGSLALCTTSSSTGGKPLAHLPHRQVSTRQYIQKEPLPHLAYRDVCNRQEAPC